MSRLAHFPGPNKIAIGVEPGQKPNTSVKRRLDSRCVECRNAANAAHQINIAAGLDRHRSWDRRIHRASPGEISIRADASNKQVVAIQAGAREDGVAEAYLGATEGACHGHVALRI